jgi:hypothetical protein
MNRRYSLYAAALALLCSAQVARATVVQVNVDAFTGQPTNHLINFDTDASGSPIANGQSLQNAYASYGGDPFHGITFEADDRAVARNTYGTSAPNQASGGVNDLSSINVYFNTPVSAVGAWGYDFVLKAYDASGNLLLQVAYSDGRPCTIEPFYFREQRFLGIQSDSQNIVQAQFSRFYQDQTECGYRIDDLQFLQKEPVPPPTPTAGNLQITWNNCSGQAGSSPYTVFDCDPSLGTLYSLIGSFQVMSSFDDLIAADASFDIVLDGQGAMSPFWHFETGGCNAGGVSASTVRPVDCGGYQTPWGASGSQAQAFVTGYKAGDTFANYGRLLMTVARPADSPVTLAGAPARYFGWALQFTMDNSGTCAGCADPASIRINSLALYNNHANSGGYLIDRGGPGSQPCASINNGGTACDPTAAKTKTWGQLKSLYR